MSDETAFDYIVVGAGAAGCAAAARLAETGRHSVLLLETGKDDRWIWLRVPLGIGKVLASERAVRRFFTESEPGLKGRRVFWPRGRVLGGSSGVNGMIWVRGDPGEYDNWAAMGNYGWDHASLMPHFERMEATTVGKDGLRGRNGAVTITEYSPRDPLSSAFHMACQKAGIPDNPDYNGASYEGVGFLQFNTKQGLRVSAREAYLAPGVRPKSLTVVTGAMARSLILEERRATGVVVRLSDGATRTYKARREIIVSGGAINSPQLLELSGIGDSERLRALGIEPKHHLPAVGEGLRDHLHIRLTFRATRPGTINDIMSSPVRKAWLALTYAMRRNGLMSGGAATVHALARSRPDIDRPDLKIQLHPFTVADSSDPDRIILDRFPGFGIGTFQLRPEATGSVHVASTDPAQAPVIHAGYLDRPEDVACSIAGVRYVRRIADQDVFRPFVAEEMAPGRDAQSDDEIEQFIREAGSTSYHPIGTCRMGTDPDAVVDPELRVNGIEGLRVADASIFPTMPSSNTHAPSILAGEKVAAMITGRND